MTGWNNTPTDRSWDTVDDWYMLAMWRQNHNTLDIARLMTRPESEIANRLPAVLLRARQDAEWSAA